jgi:hypothetical protein
MEKKVCSKCEEEKDTCNFNKDKHKQDGLKTICRECVKVKNEKYRKKDPIKYKEQQKKYRDSNKEKESIRISIWRNNNKDKRSLYANEYDKSRKNTDPIYKLRRITRSRLYSFIKTKNITKQNRTFDIVGCTPEFLKEHIEKQFTEGMSWELLGQHIHIDHIIPLSSANTEEDVYKLCHYTNLQPLWAKDNLKKSNKH